MSFLKVISKIFFMYLIIFNLSQPLLHAQDVHEKIYQKARVVFNILFNLTHQLEMKRFGNKKCSQAEKLQLHAMLKELGVTEDKLPPIKELDTKKHKRGGITTSTGIWLGDSSPLTLAHEAYHYADKHSQKGLTTIALSGLLLALFSRRMPHVVSNLSVFAFGAVSALLQGACISRYFELKACNYSIIWGCTHGHEQLVREHLQNSATYYEKNPDRKRVLNSLKPSGYEYHLFEKQAYERWKMKNT